MAEPGLLHCLKFFSYKLGQEIFLMAVNMFGLCRNFMVTLHGYPHPSAFWAIAGLWPNYCLFLILLLLYQYLLSLAFHLPCA